MTTTIKTDVIIVGAGPTGLSLACQLTRYGNVLLRPDHHIGSISETSASRVMTYLKSLGKITT
jgi:glycine/D-amino acid oxidase-like deaminating enzyme